MFNPPPLPHIHPPSLQLHDGLPLYQPNVKAACDASRLPDDASQQRLLHDFLKAKADVDMLRTAKNRPKPPVKLVSRQAQDGQEPAEATC